MTGAAEIAQLQAALLTELGEREWLRVMYTPAIGSPSADYARTVTAYAASDVRCSHIQERLRALRRARAAA